MRENDECALLETYSKKQLQVLKMAKKVHEGEVISIVLKRQVMQVGRAPVYSLHWPVWSLYQMKVFLM